jgi:hypothetical protein
MRNGLMTALIVLAIVALVIFAILHLDVSVH